MKSLILENEHTEDHTRETCVRNAHFFHNTHQQELTLRRYVRALKDITS